MSARGQSPRGEARREELLGAVVADVRAQGLVGWSLRRAAAAAGTTHKVLLYHFASGEDLLSEALAVIRRERIAATTAPSALSAGKGLRQVWAALRAESGDARVLDQATGLAIYDPEGHRRLGQQATAEYLPWLVELCPRAWSAARREATATLLLAVLRGLLADLLTSGDAARVDAAVDRMARLLDA